jgi:hypothetical protein
MFSFSFLFLTCMRITQMQMQASPEKTIGLIGQPHANQDPHPRVSLQGGWSAGIWGRESGFGWESVGIAPGIRLQPAVVRDVTQPAITDRIARR